MNCFIAGYSCIRLARARTLEGYERGAEGAEARIKRDSVRVLYCDAVVACTSKLV